MTCSYCSEELEVEYQIPEDPNVADATKPKYSCRKCGLEKGIICQKHEEAHQAFAGGGHACEKCIEETVEEIVHHADSIVGCFTRRADPKLWNEVNLWTNALSDAASVSDKATLMHMAATSFQILRAEKTDIINPFLGDFFGVDDFVISVLESFERYPPNTLYSGMVQ